MDLFEVRSALMAGKSIYDLPLKVTYYARVSTDKDAQLNSLDNQIYHFEEHIQKVSNWTYIDGYVDEGISGSSTLKRENFLKMIHDGKRGNFDLILTKEISRFLRSTLDSIKYTQELLGAGVGVLFQSDNINTILPDSELRLTIMASVAQEEVRKLSERVHFGMKNAVKKERVLGNNVIYGYTKDDGKLVIHEEEAKTIRRVFELYSQDLYGGKRVAQILSEEGFVARNGNPFIATTITGFIRNPKYKGYYRTNTTRTVDFRLRKREKLSQDKWVTFECNENCPPIISEELWNKANEILVRRSKSLLDKQTDKSIFQTRYPFSGRMYCAEHNHTFMRVCGEKRKNNPVWVCGLYTKGGLKNCESPFLYEKELYAIMKDVIGRYIDNKSEIVAELQAEYRQAMENTNLDSERQKFEKEIMLIESKKEKILDLLIDGTLPKSEFTERNNSFNDKLEVLQSQINEIEMQKEKMMDFNKFANQLNKTISEKLNLDANIDEYIKLLINRIIVSKIDGDRRNISLKVYFKHGQPIETEYRKTEYLLCGNVQNHDRNCRVGTW